MYGTNPAATSEELEYIKLRDFKMSDKIDFSKWKLSYKKLREIITESSLFTSYLGDIDEEFGLTYLQRNILFKLFYLKFSLTQKTFEPEIYL